MNRLQVVPQLDMRSKIVSNNLEKGWNLRTLTSEELFLDLTSLLTSEADDFAIHLGKLYVLTRTGNPAKSVIYRYTIVDPLDISSAVFDNHTTDLDGFGYVYSMQFANNFSFENRFALFGTTDGLIYRKFLSFPSLELPNGPIGTMASFDTGRAERIDEIPFFDADGFYFSQGDVFYHYSTVNHGVSAANFVASKENLGIVSSMRPDKSRIFAVLPNFVLGQYDFGISGDVTTIGERYLEIRPSISTSGGGYSLFGAKKIFISNNGETLHTLGFGTSDVIRQFLLYPRQWSAAASYQIGQIVSYSRNVYTSLADNNEENVPPLQTSSDAFWSRVGAENFLKPFEFEARNIRLSDQAENLGTITYEILPDEVFSAIGFFNLDAKSVRVELVLPDSTVVYDTTKNTKNYLGGANWYDVFFNPAFETNNLFFMDVPPYKTATVNITIDNGTGIAKVGQIAMGRVRDWGAILNGSEIRVKEFASFEPNAFGERVDYTDQGSVNVIDYRLSIQSAQMERLRREYATDMRAKGSMFYAADDAFGLNAFGFAVQANFPVLYNISEISLEVEQPK